MRAITALLAAAVMLACLVGTHAEGPRVSVRLVPYKVVIHQNSAIVSSRSNVTLPVGESVLVLSNVTSIGAWNRSTEESSLQLHVGNGSDVVVNRVVWTWEPMHDENDPLVIREKAIIENLTNESSYVSMEKAAVEEHTRLLDVLMANAVDKQKALLDHFTNVMAALSDFEKQKHQLVLRAHVLERRYNTLMGEIMEARTRLVGLQEQHRVAFVYVTREGDDNAAGRSSDVFLLEVSHVVDSAMWRPFYELRYNSTSRVLTMVYNAIARQSSGSSWDNVSVLLCTGMPSTDRHLPEMPPWRVMLLPRRDSGSDSGSYFSSKVIPQQRSRNEYAGSPSQKRRSGEAFVTTMQMPPSGQQRVQNQVLNEIFAEEVEEPSYHSANVAATGVSDIFSLADVHSLPHKQEVRMHIVSMQLDARMLYNAVPKLSSRIFVRADVRNTSPYTILAGDSIVFLDDSFASTSTVPHISVGGTAKVDIGVESAVIVTRKLLQSTLSESGGLLSEHRHMREDVVEIAVENRNRRGYNITVRDAIPLSNTVQLEVNAQTNWLELSYANGKLFNASVSQTGIVEWSIHVNAGGTLKLPLKYSASCPWNMDIIDA